MEKGRERAGDTGLLVVPGGRPWRICWVHGPEIICGENACRIVDGLSFEPRSLFQMAETVRSGASANREALRGNAHNAFHR